MAKTKDVREAVESELTFDPLVDATNITVKNINGEVALNGTVPSYPQYAGQPRRPSASPASRTCTTTSKSCCRRATTATTRR